MIIHGDCLEVLKTLEPDSVDCCVTSPPYWGLRDYGVSGQLGLEKTPEEYTAKIVAVFQEVKRVLKPQAILWLNLGDSYASDTKGSGGLSTKQLSNAGSFYNGSQRLNHGLKPKDLCGIPWRVAFALQADGWYLRQDIIWHKPNPMPESVTDRCTKAHEYIFLLAKNARYYYDCDVIRQEPTGRTDPIRFTQKNASDSMLRNDVNREIRKDGLMGANRRSVWTVATHAFPEAHFATFPEALVVPMIKAGCPEGGTVLDPFNGAATTGVVATKLGRKYIGIELNQEYIAMSEKRIAEAQREYDYKQGQGQLFRREP